MISVPPRWTRTVGAHLWTLTPPEGRAAAEIRYHERLAPVRPFVALVRDTLGAELAVERGPEPFVTREGEHGCWARLAGGRFVAVVFGDDFANLIDAAPRQPELADALERVARALAVEASLGLGIRRRRFLYAPPPGWYALATGLVATFYPPDFPRNRTLILVYPASPSSEPPEAVFQTLLAEDEAAGLVLVGLRGPQPATARKGLEGLHWQMSARDAQGAPFHRDLAVLRAQPFNYSVRMDTSMGDRLLEHRDVFLAVVRSAEPVPTPGARRPRSDDERAAGMALHWTS